MDLINKISILISELVPGFVRADHQTFIDFLEAYYEFMEQSGGPIESLGNFQNQIDVDKSVDIFFRQFKKQYMDSIPENLLSDKRLALKHIKDFYSNKGNEKSYKFLFRILFNDEITLTFPKEDILKASDGRWITKSSIFVRQLSGDPFLLERQILIGSDSGSTAFVDVVHRSQEGPYLVYELILNSFTGDFNVDEIATATLPDLSTIQVQTFGIIKDIEVLDGGFLYQVGDAIPVVDLTGNGVNAQVQVKTIQDLGLITGFNIINGGTGYRVGDPIIFNELSTNGFGAIAEVSSLINTTPINVNSDIIGDHQNTIISTVASITLNVFLTFINIDTGEISTINIIDPGQNYDNLPLITIGQTQPTFDIPAGNSADIKALSASSGKIVSFDVVNPGVGFVTHPSQPDLNLTTKGDGLADAKINIFGGPHIKPGFWLDNRGKLSSDKFLQDNFFYQVFSYVINSNVGINDYRDIVNNLVHPSGFKLFGQVDVSTLIANSLKSGTVLGSNLSHIFVEIGESSVNVTNKLNTANNIKHLVAVAKPVVSNDEPVFIFHYENEIIDDYKTIILQDFPGFIGIIDDRYQRIADITTVPFP